MKKLLAFLLITGVLAACNNESKGVETKVDSLNQRKDTLLDHVDSTASAKIDSIKDRSKELKEKFDSSIEAKKDSIKGK